MKIIIKKEEQRGDYEVINETGKCLGFVWESADYWMCRIGERAAEKFETYDQAIVKAKILAIEDSTQCEIR